MPDPFKTSESLASWVAEVLGAAGIDEIADWRMLEYWFQVEVFRALQAGKAGLWRHLGGFEQPYITDKPNSGAKENWKYVDLLVGEPDSNFPKRMAWIELKDLGRAPKRLVDNAKGVGRDLAALKALDVPKTADVFLNPTQNVKDASRLEEWKKIGRGVPGAKHLVAQAVIVPEDLIKNGVEENILVQWIGMYKSRLGKESLSRAQDPQIKKASTGKMAVFGLVEPLNP